MITLSRDIGHAYSTGMILGILGYMLCARIDTLYGYWPAALSLVVVYLLGSRWLVGRWFP